LCLVGAPVHGGSEGFGEIQAIYILAEAYGQGLADRLMAKGAAWLAEHGWAGVTLRVMEGNGRARAFYERLGGTAFAGGDHEVQGILVRDVEYRWPSAAALAKTAAARSDG
jgi:GNAT superfamily N-acetyltransferase